MAVASPTRTDRWLFGPLPDLLFGCGLLYAIAFAAHAVACPAIRSATPSFLLPLLILALSTPHYGGTLVRVYDQRRDRQAYAVFAVWVTLALIALFFVALQNTLLASLLFTLYLTWSPWHYTGQNYGIAVMFLRRRGVAVTPSMKRWLHASFVLSYALTFFLIHADSVPNAVPTTAAVRFVPLGLPLWLANPALLILGAAWVASSAAFARLVLHQAAWRAAGPTAALMLTQTLWFPLPLAAQHLGWATSVEPLSLDFRGHY